MDNYGLGYDYIENTSYHDPDDSHGTEVGGVAGAKTNNGIGIAGISGGNNSKGVTLISYRLVHSNGSGATHKYADAIYDAVNDGANIINLSIGHSETAEINAAIQYAYSQGVTIVCAAGDNTGSVAYPASLPQTIGVGSYSQYVGSIEQGSGLDLVAPCIVYTTTMSGYSITGGSSFSSPLVAGTVALMLSKNPNLTPPQIRDILRNTATKVSGYNYDSYGWNSSVGYGLLNTFKALLSACNTAFMKTSVICPTPSTYTINNLPSSLYVSWHYLGDNNSTTPPFIMTTSGNTCTVENYNSISFSGTIIADIMSGTTVLATLKKRVRGVSALTGTFHQEGGYYHYQNYPSFTRSLNSTITVNQLCTITLQSPKFKDMNISISQGGGYVQSFSYDGNQTITFVAAYNNTNKQFVISGIGNGGSCNNFSITVNTTKTPIQPLTFSMTANVDDGRVEVGIMRVTYDDSSQTTSLSDDYSTEKGTWTLEVYNATTGEKVFCQEVGGSNYMIDTTGWKPGVYVVKVTIDKEELTEKVIVK